MKYSAKVSRDISLRAEKPWAMMRQGRRPVGLEVELEVLSWDVVFSGVKNQPRRVMREVVGKEMSSRGIITDEAGNGLRGVDGSRKKIDFCCRQS